MLIILLFHTVCLLTLATADLLFSHYMERDCNMGSSSRPSRELELTFTTNNNARLVSDGGFCLPFTAYCAGTWCHVCFVSFSFFLFELFFPWPWIYKKKICIADCVTYMTCIHTRLHIHCMFFIDGSQTCRQHLLTDTRSNRLRSDLIKSFIESPITAHTLRKIRMQETYFHVSEDVGCYRLVLKPLSTLP